MRASAADQVDIAFQLRAVGTAKIVEIPYGMPGAQDSWQTRT